MFRSQVDDRELRAQHAVPLHFQASNRSVGAQHAVPACTRPKRECICEMIHLARTGGRRGAGCKLRIPEPVGLLRVPLNNEVVALHTQLVVDNLEFQ